MVVYGLKIPVVHIAILYLTINNLDSKEVILEWGILIGSEIYKVIFALLICVILQRLWSFALFHFIAFQ